MAPHPRFPHRLWFVYILGCTPGFRRASCKRFLKLTMSRIKLLNRRREFQVRQLKLDVAQLLQKGKRAEAESRAEKLWKESSVLSMYVKVGEYCQFVKANLYNIAWQRECPTDLREALESLYFAASHCSDLPELADVREIMANKYGKDFSTGAHVNKQFLQAFYEKVPPADCKEALIKQVCRECNVKFTPHIAQPSPLVARKPVSPALRENSSSCHGQDVSCASYDTQDVSLQRGKQRQQVESDPRRPSQEDPSDRHSRVDKSAKLVKMPGVERDGDAVYPIPAQSCASRLQTQLPEKTHESTAGSRPKHTKRSQKNEVKVDGHEVDARTGFEDSNPQKTVAPMVYSRSKSKQVKAKDDAAAVNGGHSWKHSPKVYDHGKAEMEAVLESPRRSRSHKLHDDGPVGMGEIAYEDQIDHLRSKKGRGHSRRSKHSTDETANCNAFTKHTQAHGTGKWGEEGNAFDATEGHHHHHHHHGGTLEVHGETITWRSKGNHVSVQTQNEEIRIEKKHRPVKIQYEEIRIEDRWESHGKSTKSKAVADEQQWLDDELIRASQRGCKESKRTRKKKNSHSSKRNWEDVEGFAMEPQASERNDSRSAYHVTEAGHRSYEAELTAAEIAMGHPNQKCVTHTQPTCKDGYSEQKFVAGDGRRRGEEYDEREWCMKREESKSTTGLMVSKKNMTMKQTESNKKDGKQEEINNRFRFNGTMKQQKGGDVEIGSYDDDLATAAATIFAKKPFPFSKPPERPPPPIPSSSSLSSHRTSSLPNQSSSTTAFPPQRSQTLEPDHLRGQHVHPNLPEYNDLVARFAALKREISFN